MNFDKGTRVYCFFSFLVLTSFIILESFESDFRPNTDASFSDFSVGEENVTPKYEFDGKQKVNINLASVEILTKNLYGIGESKAREIVDYREKMGGFYSISEILNVNGIGENIFSNIKDSICV